MPAELETWYKSIPVVTRVYLTLACLTSGAVTFEFITPLNLYLNYRLVWQNYQIWRLLTNFLFFDKITIHLFFHMHFLYSYCRRLEEHWYHRRTADFLFMLMFGAISMLLISACIYDIVFLSHSMVVMVVYIWSRRNPEEHLNILGVFTIAAPYLAYVMLAFSAMFGGVSSAAVDVIGIVVGHFYWFLADILPKLIGFHILKTPSFVSALFPNDEVVTMSLLCATENSALIQKWRHPFCHINGIIFLCLFILLLMFLLFFVSVTLPSSWQ